jgi:hypothetical protein
MRSQDELFQPNDGTAQKETENNEMLVFEKCPGSAVVEHLTQKS